MNKLNVAIIGQGRSGMDIHGKYFLSEINEQFNVVAVVEEIEQRRMRAKEEFKCDVYDNYTALLDRKDIDLVVNSSFSHMHYPITMDLLKHKFNVLVEKPFARHARECDDMIATAKQNGVMLAVFQQARFAPCFQKIKEVLASKVLGEIIQISIKYSAYSRRWDWQCSQRYNGGSLLNTGPHPMDQAVDLLDSDVMPHVFSKLARVNTSGDAEDFAKVILTAPSRPLIEVQITACDAYTEFITYNIQGSRGTLKATVNQVDWKYFNPSEEVDRPLILEPLCKEDGTPAYCQEQLTWHECNEKVEHAVFTSSVHEYYKNIYNHLVNGEPLVVKTEQVRQQIAIIEQVHYQNPLSVIY